MLSSSGRLLHIILLHSTGSSFSLLPLPVNPLLGLLVSSVPSLALPLGSIQVEQLHTASSTIIVAEGIPPIQAKLVEQIWWWEYVDLSKLLGGQEMVPGKATAVIDGQKL